MSNIVNTQNFMTMKLNDFTVNVKIKCNVTADFGNTPGHYAGEGGFPACLNCFLQHDGEIDIQNIKGDSPLDTAKKFGHPLLMQKGGMCDIFILLTLVLLSIFVICVHF